MTLLGDVSREGFLRVLRRLQGSGAYSTDPDAAREAELSGIAGAFAEATAVVLKAIESHFPGLASGDDLNDWESFLRLGNSPGRTDDERRERLRIFQRVMPYLTTSRVRESLKSIGAATLYRVEDAVAAAYRANPLSGYLVGIALDWSDPKRMRAAQDGALRAAPPGSWPVHVSDGSDLLYGDAFTEGESAITRDERTEVDPQSVPHMQYGPQFFPGMSEIADPLNGLLAQQWQTQGVEPVQGSAGYFMVVGGSVNAGQTLTLDSGANLDGAWEERYINVFGYVHTAAVWDTDVDALAPDTACVFFQEGDAAASDDFRLLRENGTNTNLYVGTGPGGELIARNAGGSTLHFALAVRATSRMSARVADALARSYLVQRGKPSEATMEDMATSLRQDARIWWSDQVGHSDTDGTVTAVSGSDAGGVRRFGLLLNARRPPGGSRQYVLDSSVDWRNRVLVFAFGWASTGIDGSAPGNEFSHSPHAVLDTAGAFESGLGGSPSAHFQCGRRGGAPTIAFTGSVGVRKQLRTPNNQSATVVGELYARISDGALCVEIDSSTQEDENTSLAFMVHASGMIDGSEDWPDDGLVIAAGSKVEAHRLARINDTMTMVQAHERVPVSIADIEPAQNSYGWERRSLCAPLGPESRGSVRIPGFVPRRLRLGDPLDRDFLFRQNVYGERVFVMNLLLTANNNALGKSVDVFGSTAFSGRAEQIDWRDRIVVMQCIHSGFDVGYSPGSRVTGNYDSICLYTAAPDDGSSERVLATIGSGLLEIVLIQSRDPLVADLVIRRTSVGATIYFAGTAWASPQLGFADVRR